MAFNVSSVSPTFNATGVYLDAVLTATFNEVILDSSVNEFNFNLVESDTDVAVLGTVIKTGSSTIRFTPTEDLRASTRYTAVIMGNTWGILSAGGQALPETVSWTFTTGLYLDSDDAIDEIPAAVASEDEPTGDELYIVSSSPDNSSVNVLTDRVAITFTGVVPSGTYADVEASHPLGYPAGDNYWAENFNCVLNENQLIISSSGDLATALNNSVQFIDKEALITESSILVSESGHAMGSLRHVRFGVDSNFLYKVKVHIPTNEFVPEINFVSKLLPQLVSVEEIRLFGGSSLSKFNDFTIATLLYKTSLTAKGLWTSHGHTWPTVVPYYAQQYVLYRSLRDLLSIMMRDTSAVGGGSQKLGDLALSTRPDSKVMLDDLRGLDLYVTLFAQKLTEGNVNSIPLQGPSWAEVGRSGGHAVIGANALDASDREAPMHRDDWTRDIEEKTNS